MFIRQEAEAEAERKFLAETKGLWGRNKDRDRGRGEGGDRERVLDHDTGHPHSFVK